MALGTNQKTPFHLGLIAMYNKTASSPSKTAKKNSETEKIANYKATNYK